MKDTVDAYFFHTLCLIEWPIGHERESLDFSRDTRFQYEMVECIIRYRRPRVSTESTRCESSGGEGEISRQRRVRLRRRTCEIFWRKGRDSNSRELSPYLLSKQAHSATMRPFHCFYLYLAFPATAGEIEGF